MKRSASNREFVILSIGVITALAVLGADSGSQELVEINSGGASFEAPTNMPAVVVKGKSNGLQGKVRVTKSLDGLLLESIEARVPIKSLVTGMGVRDEHMRKYVFTSADGHLPDLFFTAEKGACSKADGRPDYTCQVPGMMTIRGTLRPLVISLRVKEQVSSAEFRVIGNAVIKLNEYGIAPPVQFGVKVLNDVRFEFEFTGKEKAMVTTAGGSVE
jgi:polyisoprenoid-binding protein YceI